MPHVQQPADANVDYSSLKNTEGNDPQIRGGAGDSGRVHQNAGRAREDRGDATGAKRGCLDDLVIVDEGRAHCRIDQDGAKAVLQDLKSSPTSIYDANSAIAYGMLPGNKTIQADAIRAYI